MSSFYGSENLKMGSEHLRLVIKTQALENMIQTFGACAVLTQRKPIPKEIKTFNRKEDIKHGKTFINVQR